MKSGDFYNRVFTSNRVLNTTTVQPVIRPAKIENGEEIRKEKIIKVEEPIIENNLLEKYNLLEKELNELKERFENIENKLNKEKIVELEENKEKIIELEEFDRIIEHDE